MLGQYYYQYIFSRVRSFSYMPRVLLSASLIYPPSFARTNFLSSQIKQQKTEKKNGKEKLVARKFSFYLFT